MLSPIKRPNRAAGPAIFLSHFGELEIPPSRGLIEAKCENSAKEAEASLRVGLKKDF